MIETDPERRKANEISEKVIGAAIEVHRSLGPGLLEGIYEECLCYELGARGLSFVRQMELPVVYKSMTLEYRLRLDVVVEDLVVLELKAVDKVIPLHEAQLLTYLKLSGHWLGLILNFNVPAMRDGIRRLVTDSRNYNHRDTKAQRHQIMAGFDLNKLSENAIRRLEHGQREAIVTSLCLCAFVVRFL